WPVAAAEALRPGGDRRGGGRQDGRSRRRRHGDQRGQHGQQPRRADDRAAGPGQQTVTELPPREDCAMHRTSLLFGPVAAVCRWLVPAARAQAEDVRVTVVAIHATDRDKVIDDDLTAIAEKLKKTPFTGFRKGRITMQRLPVDGKEKTFPL